MNENLNKVREYLLDLDYNIISEDEEETLFIISKEDAGIVNMLVDVDEPLLIIEQFLFESSTLTPESLALLLKKNREIIHGAFTLDEAGTKVIFRDTLQVENLDKNEIEASINSLSLLLSEFTDEIISMAKN